MGLSSSKEIGTYPRYEDGVFEKYNVKVLGLLDEVGEGTAPKNGFGDVWWILISSHLRYFPWLRGNTAVVEVESLCVQVQGSTCSFFAVPLASMIHRNSNRCHHEDRGSRPLQQGDMSWKMMELECDVARIVRTHMHPQSCRCCNFHAVWRVYGRKMLYTYDIVSWAMVASCILQLCDNFF